MKNLKFGAFFLGLVVVVATLVTGVKAQSRERSFMVLDGRGSELGAMVSDVDVKSATAGVKVDEVHSDSPADKAGLRAGDIVVDYDGERVRSARQLSRLVRESPDDRNVRAAVVRDGNRRTVDLTPSNDRAFTLPDLGGLALTSFSLVFLSVSLLYAP